MKDLYRKHLVDAVNNLMEAEQMLSTSALNISWFGELSHLSDAYDEGEQVEFDLSLLQTVDDLNVKKLVELLDPLYEAAQYLKNINAITDEELEEAGEPNDVD